MPDPLPISAATLAAAEPLFGVRYTDTERQLMLDNLAEQIARAQQRRAVSLPAVLGPATRFDPRLPGFLPPAGRAVPGAPAESPLPVDDEDIAFAPLAALRFWIQTGKLTATRLTNIYLDRIARLNPSLFCFATITADAALRRAAELDAMTAQGKYLGPLHGIPYGMKDIIDTAGVETSWGAEPYQGRVPVQNAFITDLLHEAGAIMLGKTTVGALAYGDLWFGGRTRNPWNLRKGPAAPAPGPPPPLPPVWSASRSAPRRSARSSRPPRAAARPGCAQPMGASPAAARCRSAGRSTRSARSAARWRIRRSCSACSTSPTRWMNSRFLHRSATRPARPIEGLRVGYHPEDFEAAQPLDRQALESARALGLELCPHPPRNSPMTRCSACC